MLNINICYYSIRCYIEKRQFNYSSSQHYHCMQRKLTMLSPNHNSNHYHK